MNLPSPLSLALQAISLCGSVLRAFFCGLTGLAGAVFLTTAGTSETQAGLAQEFYVPMPEDQLIASFRGVYPPAGTIIDSSISLTPMLSSIVIYYDHWEDGYEVDLTKPQQATTEVWGDGNPGNGMPPGFSQDVIDADSVIRLRNLIEVPRAAAVLRYDGRDRIGTSKPAALTRMAWATDPGPVLAGAIQIQPTLEYGTEFVSPAGQNAPNNAFNEIFERVELCVMAAENGTQVQIDANADGVFESVVTLQRGESHAVAGILMNARLQASKPVQVHIITGDVGAQYENRWFNLFPRPVWGGEYFNPVSTVKAGNPGCVFLFNPHASALAVNYQTMSGSGSLSVPAGGMLRHEMPQGSGTRYFTAGSVPFMALGALDTIQTGTGNTSYEWGFTLIPRHNLTGAIKLGYAPGAGDEPISGNGNPAWIIAEKATRLYVDYDGNWSTGALTDPNGNKYDYHVDVKALESVRVFDSSDNNQTGLRAYVLDGTRITAAWGQDTSAAEPGNPYLDLGYTVLPHPLFYAVKTGTLIQDHNQDGVADRDDVIEYTITVANMGIVPVNAVTVRDLMDEGLVYNPGSTSLGGSPLADDPVPPKATLFPLDEAGYNIGSLGVRQTRVLKFTATVGRQGPGAATLRNLVLVTVAEQDRAEPAEHITPTRPSPCETVVVNSTTGSAVELMAGQPYSATFSAAGRDGPFTFAIGAGSLPAGLSLNASGQLTGTPATPGVYDFTVLAIDQHACASGGMVRIAVQQPLTIGNAVYFDTNGNGRMDAGEGLPHVPVQLYQGNQNPGVDAPLAATTTAIDGSYRFESLWPGSYMVHVPAAAFQTGAVLAGLIPVAYTPDGDDNAGSNGQSFGAPAQNGVISNVVFLSTGNAPTAATGETGFLSHSDDSYDSHADLTIDFGFMLPVGLGNLVFIDSNDNGRADPGEGAAGVPVELYALGQVPGMDPPVAETETAADGHYFFGDLSNGQYVAHIPARAFYPGQPLAGYSAIALGLSGDDDVGQNGINGGYAEWVGVSSGVVSLAVGSAPTLATGESGFRSGDDDSYDAAIDLTVDFGFQRTLGVGNLVFVDANENGVFDYGEGIMGVRVELYRAEQVPGLAQPVMVTHTGLDGVYLFDQLPPGQYRLFIPSTEFNFGRPLWRLLSLPGVQAGDDHLGEDGIDDTRPDINGIQTAVITLTRGEMPTDASGETGAFSDLDSRNDDDYDLTVDFGFAPPNAVELGVGNLVFVDANGNGRADNDEGRDGVLVQLFDAGDNPQTDAPRAEVTTTHGGTYLFAGLREGAYFVHVPASQFQAGAPLAGLLSVPGAGGDWGMDDDFDENGVDAEQPWVSGISSILFYLATDLEPINAWGESGHEAGMDDADDNNTDLTIDLGFSVPMGLGNLVFRDDNGNGRADAGEGVAGVTLRLYTAGMDPAFDLPVAETTTDAQGSYRFEGLSPNLYVVHIPAAMFAAGMPLHGLMNLAGTHQGDDDTGEKGQDNEAPELFGINSVWVALEPGKAPVGAAESGFAGGSDDATDANTDLTVDFGFGLPASVGNLVFHDVNGDGQHQPAGGDQVAGNADDEIGLPGVILELWSPGVDGQIGGGDDVQVRAEVMTSFDGGFLFDKLAPGRYYIVIGAANFAADGALETLPTASSIRSGADDGVDGDSNGWQPEGRATAVHGPLLTLAGGETDLSQDFGFLASLLPLSWPDWQARHAGLADTTPTGNSDGDVFKNLEEFAFGLPARSGLLTRQPVRLVIDAATQRVDVCVDQVAGINGVNYMLQVLHDLSLSPLGWLDVAGITPQVTTRPDGTEEVRYAGISELPLLAGGIGHVRVKISLDSDFNGLPEATVFSQVLGWNRRVLGTHLQTLGQGHAVPARLSARIGALAGGTLDLSGSLDGGDVRDAFDTGAHYYIEIIDGAHGGHRFDVDEAVSTGASLAIDTTSTRNTLPALPATLAGARLVLRRHVTFAELAPKTLFNATTNPATADLVMLYDNKASNFRSYWLLAHPSALRWVLQGDARLQDQSNVIVDPGAALFVQPKARTVTLTPNGMVRDHAFACPLPVGTSLCSTGWPMDFNPTQLNLNVANGFTGAATAILADQIQIWRGDSNTALQGYDSYFLLQVSSLQKWVAQGDARLLSLNLVSLIKTQRAFFLRSRAGNPGWVQSCPWTP